MASSYYSLCQSAYSCIITGEATGNNAPFPYTRKRDLVVDGLPELPFRKPSGYGVAQLKKIIESRDNIKVRIVEKTPEVTAGETSGTMSGVSESTSDGFSAPSGISLGGEPCHKSFTTSVPDPTTNIIHCVFPSFSGSSSSGDLIPVVSSSSSLTHLYSLLRLCHMMLMLQHMIHILRYRQHQHQIMPQLLRRSVLPPIVFSPFKAQFLLLVHQLFFFLLLSP